MRLIDADKAISDYAHYGISHSYDACDLEGILTECPTVEAIPKDQLDTPNNGSAYMDCIEIIQQKIDKMREGEL